MRVPAHIKTPEEAKRWHNEKLKDEMRRCVEPWMKGESVSSRYHMEREEEMRAWTEEKNRRERELRMLRPSLEKQKEMRTFMDLHRELERTGYFEEQEKLNKWIKETNPRNRTASGFELFGISGKRRAGEQERGDKEVKWMKEGRRKEGCDSEKREVRRGDVEEARVVEE